MKWLLGKKKTPEEQKNDKPICVRLDECLFVKRHGDCPEFRMKRYHQFYCNGHLLEACARLRFYSENQCEASEHMAPTGLIIDNHRAVNDYSH